MQDNINHTGSNWTGQCPRTMQEAFRGGRIHGDEPGVLSQVALGIAIAGAFLLACFI